MTNSSLKTAGQQPAANVEGKAFRISIGESRNSEYWKVEAWTWPQLTAKLSQCKRTRETFAEYQTMSKDTRGKVKDVGGFVGGALKENGKRGNAFMADRCVVALDIDEGGADTLETVREALGNCAWCAYTTHSHSSAAPRYRVVVPLLEPVTCEEYEPLARRLAEWIGIDGIDKASYVLAQLMYWPSAPKDGAFDYQEGQGEWLDGREVLRTTYKNWKDATEWPRSQQEQEAGETLRPRGGKRADPRTQPGLHGAFCRVYSVYDVIYNLLPGVYAATASPERFTFCSSETGTTGGLIIYDNGLFAKNYHNSNKTVGARLVDAFQLFVAHKFGGDTDETFRQMYDFCRTDRDMTPVWAEFSRECETLRPTAREVFADDVAEVAARDGEHPDEKTPAEGRERPQGEPAARPMMTAEDSKAYNQLQSTARALRQGWTLKDKRVRHMLGDLQQMTRGGERTAWDEWQQQMSQSAAETIAEIGEAPEVIRTKWRLGNVTYKGGAGPRVRAFGGVEFAPANVTIICAATSNGKTSFLINAALDYVNTDILGQKCLYISCEETKKQLLQRVLSTWLPIPSTDDGAERDERGKVIGLCFKTGQRAGAIKAAIKGELTCYGYNAGKNDYGEDLNPFSYDFDRLASRIRAGIDDYVTEVWPYLDFVNTSASTEDIVECVRRYKAKCEEEHQPLGVVFIDYVQVMTSDAASENRTNELKAICAALHNCALETGLPIVVAAQLNRDAVTKGIDEVTTSNLGESVDIERIAHNLYFLWLTYKTKRDMYIYWKEAQEATKATATKAAKPYRPAHWEWKRNSFGATVAGDRARRLFFRLGNDLVLKDGYMYVEQLKARDSQPGGWALYPFDGERRLIGPMDTEAMLLRNQDLVEDETPTAWAEKTEAFEAGARGDTETTTTPKEMDEGKYTTEYLANVKY